MHSCLRPRRNERLDQPCRGVLRPDETGVCWGRSPRARLMLRKSISCAESTGFLRTAANASTNLRNCLSKTFVGQQRQTSVDLNSVKNLKHPGDQAHAVH